MTREEAKAYFEECNENIITTSKDENVYDYEMQEIMGVSMRETYEANIWAISALSENKGESNHGHWERMSDLPEDKDDRYKCSQCGNIVHHSNGVNLYTFNSWCGRCGSLNNSLLAELESYKAESEGTNEKNHS